MTASPEMGSPDIYVTEGSFDPYHVASLAQRSMIDEETREVAEGAFRTYVDTLDIDRKQELLSAIHHYRAVGHFLAMQIVDSRIQVLYPQQ